MKKRVKITFTYIQSWFNEIEINVFHTLTAAMNPRNSGVGNSHCLATDVHKRHGLAKDLGNTLKPYKNYINERVNMRLSHLSPQEFVSFDQIPLSRQGRCLRPNSSREEVWDLKELSGTDLVVTDFMSDKYRLFFWIS